jgi:hypothetical protein
MLEDDVGGGIHDHVVGKITFVEPTVIGDLGAGDIVEEDRRLRRGE